MHCKQLVSKKEIFLETIKIPGIVYSDFEVENIIGEHFILEQGLCYIISGNLKVTYAGQARIFGGDDLVFYQKKIFLNLPKYQTITN